MYQGFFFFLQSSNEVIPRIVVEPLICNPLKIIYTSSLVRIMVTEPKEMASVTSLIAFAASHGIGSAVSPLPSLC